VLNCVFAATCGAQDKVRSEAESFPDAPQAQLASAFSGFSRSDILASVKDVHPDPLPPPSASLEGIRVRLRLVTPVSSRLPSGSSFQARLEKPVAVSGSPRDQLPKGTLFEGHLETQRARRVMRPGSMFMTFDRMILPNGEIHGVNLHLLSSDSAAVKADSEGLLHSALSKKRQAIQVGGTALTAKLADDLAEFAGGTAVGAGTARLIGAGAATAFFILQKGREVRLQPGDKLDVEFGRSVTESPALKMR